MQINNFIFLIQLTKLKMFSLLSDIIKMLEGISHHTAQWHRMGVIWCIIDFSMFWLCLASRSKQVIHPWED